MREWPEEWEVSLGAVGNHFGFPKAELDSLTVRETMFWLNCMAKYLKKMKAAQR